LCMASRRGKQERHAPDVLMSNFSLSASSPL